MSATEDAAHELADAAQDLLNRVTVFSSALEVDHPSKWNGPPWPDGVDLTERLQAAVTAYRESAAGLQGEPG